VRHAGEGKTIGSRSSNELRSPRCSDGAEIYRFRSKTTRLTRSRRRWSFGGVDAARSKRPSPPASG